MMIPILLILLLQEAACQQQPPNNIPSPTFFLSLTSVCRFNNAEMNPDTSFVAKGSLCAYAEEANIVYSCPAGDPYCWNQGGQCSGGSDTTAGPDEIACSDIGSGKVHWCCNSQFGNCTQTQFQQNNCWSWFANPNHDLNPLAASSSASVAMQSAVSEPTITNIVVQALASGGWVVQAETTTASTAGPIPTSNRTTSVASDASKTTSTSGMIPMATETRTSTEGSRSFSEATIAGVAVGAAVLSTLVTILFFLWRRRRNDANASVDVANVVGHESTLEVAPYKPRINGSMNELPSDQRPALFYGHSLQAMELDIHERQRPPIEKGLRDSRWTEHFADVGK